MISCNLYRKFNTSLYKNRLNFIKQTNNVVQKKLSDFSTKKVDIKVNTNKDKQNFIKFNNVQKVNDENSSYQANYSMNENQQKQNYMDRVNIDLTFEQQKHQQAVQKQNQMNKNGNNLINLKKKIKKCQSIQTFLNLSKQKSFVKQKIKFLKKKQKVLICKQELQNNIAQKEKLTQTNQNRQSQFCIENVEKHDEKDRIEQQYIQFPLYREQQVFSDKRKRELWNKIPTQRMDNDNETQDEQIEKFVERIKGELMQGIERYKRQNKKQDVQRERMQEKKNKQQKEYVQKREKMQEKEERQDEEEEKESISQDYQISQEIYF